VLRRSLGDVNGVVVSIGPGLSARVKILCSLWFPDTLALWKDLGSGSDMTGSARWWIRVMVRHG